MVDIESTDRSRLGYFFCIVQIVQIINLVRMLTFFFRFSGLMVAKFPRVRDVVDIIIKAKTLSFRFVLSPLSFKEFQ